MTEASEPKKIYLLNDIEVVFTGRKAKRTLKNNKIDERFEIQPANSNEGSWKKWVKQTDLYEIEEK